LNKIIDYIIKNKVVIIIYLIPILLAAVALADNSTNLAKNLSMTIEGVNNQYKYPIPKTGDLSIIQNNKECFIEYEVKKGDTLKKIWANNIVSYPYSISMDLVLKQNKIGSLSDIKIGDVILLPTRIDETCIIYTVKNNDTLLSISNQFKADQTLCNMVKIIKDKNGKGNVKNIEPGQILLIPQN